MNLLSAILPLHAAVAAKAEVAVRHDPLLAKYIIINRDGLEFPILFPFELQHSHMLPPNVGRPVSAGFYQFIAADFILAGGESTTLKLRSRIQDAEIIKRHLLSIP